MHPQDYSSAARRLLQFSPPSTLKTERGGATILDQVAYASPSPPPPEATLTFSPPPPSPLKIGKTAANSVTVAPVDPRPLTYFDPEVRGKPLQMCWTKSQKNEARASLQWK